MYFHWLPLYLIVHFYWPALYATVQSTDFHLTLLNVTVHGTDQQWTQFYGTIQNTDQHSVPLFATVPLIWKIKIFLKSLVWSFFDIHFYFNLYSININYIEKNATGREIFITCLSFTNFHRFLMFRLQLMIYSLMYSNYWDNSDFSPCKWQIRVKIVTNNEETLTNN